MNSITLVHRKEHFISLWKINKFNLNPCPVPSGYAKAHIFSIPTISPVLYRTVWKSVFRLGCIFRPEITSHTRKGIFLRNRSVNNARWFCAKSAKIAKRSLNLTKIRLGRNGICCAEDNHNYISNMSAKEFSNLNFS